jgi:uncharacterized protein YneF (UPF0154 family)
MNLMRLLLPVLVLGAGVLGGFWPSSRKIAGTLAGMIVLTNLASTMGNSIEYSLRRGAMGSHGMPSFAGMAIGAAVGLIAGGIAGYFSGKHLMSYGLVIALAVLTLFPWPAK